MLSPGAGSSVGDPTSSQMQGIVMQDSTVEGDLWVVIVDVVILSLTILGAGAILGNMLYHEIRGRASTVRTRIVQGLVLSDFFLGFFALISSSAYLAGSPFQHGSNTCDAWGLFLVATLWSEHLWTLVLAFSTYMILIYPLHSVTRLLEKSWQWIYLGIWTIAFGIGVMGYELYGFYPSGGICYYGNNSGLYSELMQFIPRATVFCAIVFFYAKLYVFLNRPDRIKASFSSSGRNQSSANHENTNGVTSYGSSVVEVAATSPSHRRGGRRGHSCDRIRQSFAKFSFRSSDGERRSDAVGGRADFEKNENGGVGTASRPEDLPPWERLALPAFQIDGQRYGGGVGLSAAPSRPVWSDWKGMGLGGGKRSRGRPTTPRDSQTRTNNSADSASTTTQGPTTIHERRQLASMSDSLMSPISESISPRTFTSPRFEDDSVTLRQGPTAEVDPLDASMGSPPFPSSGDDASPVTAVAPLQLELPPYYPIVPPLSASGSLTPNSSLVSAQPSHRFPRTSAEIRRGSLPSDTGSRRGSGPVSFALPEISKKDPTSMSTLSMPAALHVDETDRVTAADRGNDEEEEDDEEEEIDFARILQESYDDEPRQRADRLASEDTEIVQESMSSYLNRKTAMLMLYFPLAYVLLFSVSIIRLIYDFAAPSDPPALRAVSRWLIFAQGLVDAIIYGYVEWNTKRVVRKKVRRGLVTPDASRQANSQGSARGFLSDHFGRSRGKTTSGVDPEKSRHSVV